MLLKLLNNILTLISLCVLNKICCKHRFFTNKEGAVKINIIL